MLLLKYCLIFVHFQILDQLILSKEDGGGVNNSGAIDLSLLTPNVSLDTMLKARDLLNSSNPRNIWKIMTTLHNVSTSVENGLSQFNWDVFIPMEDEETLETFYEDHQRQKELGITYILAGVIFDSLELNSSHSAKTGRMRIRMNSSAVHSTLNYKEV